MSPRFHFTAEMWEYGGDASWYFVTLPTDISDDIDDQTPHKRGFGSVRVEVKAGDTTWRTSVFPDKASGTFVLPIKRAVRDAEGIEPGEAVTLEISLIQLETESG